MKRKSSPESLSLMGRCAASTAGRGGSHARGVGAAARYPGRRVRDLEEPRFDRLVVVAHPHGARALEQRAPGGLPRQVRVAEHGDRVAIERLLEALEQHARGVVVAALGGAGELFVGQPPQRVQRAAVIALAQVVRSQRPRQPWPAGWCLKSQ